jgi:hypothetical protein
VILLTCSPRHASSAPPRKAADDGERAGRREKADAAMLAVRLAIIVSELVKVAIDHASGGGLGRIL